MQYVHAPNILIPRRCAGRIGTILPGEFPRPFPLRFSYLPICQITVLLDSRYSLKGEIKANAAREKNRLARVFVYSRLCDAESDVRTSILHQRRW